MVCVLPVPGGPCTVTPRCCRQPRGDCFLLGVGGQRHQQPLARCRRQPPRRRRVFEFQLAGLVGDYCDERRGHLQLPGVQRVSQVAEEPPVHRRPPPHHQYPGRGDRRRVCRAAAESAASMHLRRRGRAGRAASRRARGFPGRTAPRAPSGIAHGCPPAGRSRSAGVLGAGRSPCGAATIASGTTEIAPVFASKASCTWVVTSGCTIRVSPMIQLRMP